MLCDMGTIIASTTRDASIRIDDEGNPSCSSDGEESWVTIGKLTDPAKGVQILLEILDCDKVTLQ